MKTHLRKEDPHGQKTLANYVSVNHELVMIIRSVLVRIRVYFLWARKND